MIKKEGESKIDPKEKIKSVSQGIPPTTSKLERILRSRITWIILPITITLIFFSVLSVNFYFAADKISILKLVIKFLLGWSRKPYWGFLTFTIPNFLGIILYVYILIKLKELDKATLYLLSLVLAIVLVIIVVTSTVMFIFSLFAGIV